jgi:hypothetical protein
MVQRAAPPALILPGGRWARGSQPTTYPDHVPTWFTHITWTATIPGPDDAMQRLVHALAQYGDGPGTPGYTLAGADDGTWCAGYAVTAETIEEAAAASASMLRTAALVASQGDVAVTRLDVLDQTHRALWAPPLPGSHADLATPGGASLGTSNDHQARLGVGAAGGSLVESSATDVAR